MYNYSDREDKSGLKFLFIIACEEVLKCEVQFCHSLDVGIRGKFITKKKINYTDIREIEKKMREYISKEFPILKLNVSREDAMSYYNRYNEQRF